MTPDYSALTWSDLLAEPELRSPHWQTVTTARMIWCRDLALPGRNKKAALDGLGQEHRADGLLRLARAWGDGLAPPEWPADLVPEGDLELLGTSAPRLIVVGDVRSTDAPLPFFSRSGRRLLEALRLLGYDELGLCITNAREPPPPGKAGKPRSRLDLLHQLAELTQSTGSPWLILGERARDLVVKELGAVVDVFVCQHPQAHCRFFAKEGAKGYADLLVGAGLPEGPWHGREPGLPTVDAIGRQKLADLVGLPVGVAYRPRGHSSRSADTGSDGISEAKKSKAHNLYVTGAVDSLKAASEQSGAEYSRVCALAREEGWQLEREQIEQRIRTKAMDEAVDREVKNLIQVRDLAWAGAITALADVVTRMRLPPHDERHYSPTTADAVRLGQLAVLVRGEAPADEDQKQIADLLAKGPKALMEALVDWQDRLEHGRPVERPGDEDGGK